MTSEEILGELAAQTADVGEFFGVTFEVGEDYWAIGDARLSAFASQSKWAVAIEVVGFNRACEYELRIYLLGNCLEERPEFYLADFNRPLDLRILAPGQDDPGPDDHEAFEHISRQGVRVEVGSEAFDFAPSVEELAGTGIELSERELTSGELSPVQLLRFVCEKLDHPFFLSEAELRVVMEENAPDFEADEQLELLMQTRDWIHPRVGLGKVPGADGSETESEWEISPREAFATLAQMLATRDLAVWDEQDASKFNSHWRNWAEIEIEKERADAEKIRVAQLEFLAQMEIVPRRKRAEFLFNIRSIIERSPSLLQWSQQNFMEIEGAKIRIFRELSPAIDTIIAELESAPDV